MAPTTRSKRKQVLQNASTSEPAASLLPPESSSAKRRRISQRMGPQTSHPSVAPRQPTSMVFMLPMELRALIYKFALVLPEEEAREKYEITVAHGLPEPPLLHVDRQIRSEARPIFYGQHFYYDSVNRSASLIIKWSKKHNLIGKHYHVRFSGLSIYSIDSNASDHADNILAYIRAWYTDDIDFHPSLRHRGDDRETPQYSLKFVEHRLWDMAMRLREARTRWEVAQPIIMAAMDLVDCRPLPGRFRAEPFESCCIKHPDGKY